MRAWAALLLGLIATPAMAAPFDFDCDAPFEDNSDVWQNRSGPPYRVSGRIDIVELHDILPQPPGSELRIVGPVPDTRRAQVTFADRDAFVSLEIVPLDRTGDNFEVVLSWQVEGNIEARTVTQIARRAPGYDALPFVLATDGRRATLEAGDARAEIELPIALGRRGEIRLSCSGGNFVFDDIDWGGD